MTLKGKLENFGLGELLQTLALNRHTGTLVLERDEEHKKIYFSTGTITLLSTGKSVRLGEILRREGCVSDEQLEEALQEQKSSGKLFGQILVEKEIVALEDVQRALGKKVEEEIYDLFLWPAGTFEFLSDYCPAELMDPLQRFTQLKIDPSALIMEGLRQLDEFKVIREVLPDARMLIQKVVEHPSFELTQDAHEVWSITSTNGPISETLAKSPLTRFHTMECLYQFVKAGWVRTLDFQEHLAVARDERKLGNTEEAASLFQALYETQPRARSDREFLKEAGFFLADMRRPEIAAEALTKALEAYMRTGENSAAWIIGLRLIDLDSPSLDLLRSIWTIHAVASETSAVEVFWLLAKGLFEQGDHDELEFILAEGLEITGEDPNYWVLRGDNARELGKARVAAEWYERALDYLREGRDDTEIIRLLRTIYDLDPDREDIAERLKQTLGRQELREATRRRRHLIAACFALVVVATFAYAVTYEVRARQLFDTSRSLEIAYALDEQSLAQPKDDTPAELLAHFEVQQSPAAERIRSGYQELIDGYPLSSRADIAKDAIDRLNNWEQTLRADVERIRLESEKNERRLREELQSRYRNLRNLEQTAALKKDYQLLIETRTSLLNDCAPLIDPASIRYPLYIETAPPGANVEIEGAKPGKTPYLHEYKPGSRFSIALHRPGCHDKTIQFVDSGRAVMRVLLDRKPLTRTYFPPIGGSVMTDGETFYISSRDGWLYATPNTRLVGQEARWRLRIGVPGHPAAKLAVIGGDLLVGSYDGTIQRVELSGQPVWTQTINDALLALSTATASEAWIVAGDERGNINLLDARTGEVTQTSHLGFPIDAIHVSDRVQVTTRRNQLVTLSLPDLEEIDRTDLPTSALAFAPNGDLLLSDGRMGLELLPAPRTAIRSRDGVLSFASRDQKLVLVSNMQQTILPASDGAISAPIQLEEQIFVTDKEGHLHAYSLEGHKNWSIALGGLCQDVRIGYDGNYIVFLRTGGVVILEGNSP